MEKEQTRPVGMIPSGLFIAGVNKDGKPDGFLASWVQQVSFDPLVISLAVGNDKPFLDVLKKNKKFCLNILAKSNSEMMKVFWKPPEEGKTQFDTLKYNLTDYGPLLEESAAAIECSVLDLSTPGDHTIVFGQVDNTYLYNPEESPSVHIRKFGDGY